MYTIMDINIVPRDITPHFDINFMNEPNGSRRDLLGDACRVRVYADALFFSKGS